MALFASVRIRMDSVLMKIRFVNHPHPAVDESSLQYNSSSLLKDRLYLCCKYFPVLLEEISLRCDKYYMIGMRYQFGDPEFYNRMERAVLQDVMKSERILGYIRSRMITTDVMTFLKDAIIWPTNLYIVHTMLRMYNDQDDVDDIVNMPLNRAMLFEDDWRSLHFPVNVRPNAHVRRVQQPLSEDEGIYMDPNFEYNDDDSSDEWDTDYSDDDELNGDADIHIRGGYRLPAAVSRNVSDSFRNI